MARKAQNIILKFKKMHKIKENLLKSPLINLLLKLLVGLIQNSHQKKHLKLKIRELERWLWNLMWIPLNKKQAQMIARRPRKYLWQHKSKIKSFKIKKIYLGASYKLIFRKKAGLIIGWIMSFMLIVAEMIILLVLAIIEKKMA